MNCVAAAACARDKGYNTRFREKLGLIPRQRHEQAHRQQRRHAVARQVLLLHDELRRRGRLRVLGFRGFA